MSGASASVEELEEYGQILSQNGIQDPIRDIVITTPNLEGAGFASAYQYITIQFQDSQLTDLELFAKKKLGGDSKSWDEMKIFEKESGVYNVLLKDIQEFWFKQTGYFSKFHF